MNVDAFIAKIVILKEVSILNNKFFVKETDICSICGKQKLKCFDIRDKKQQKAIENNIMKPELLIDKAIHTLKFHKLHD
jgi:hypothetical protein